MNDLLQKSKVIGLVLGPVLFCLIFFTLTPGVLTEKSIIVLALGAWMVTWWATEAMPIPVSALLPMAPGPGEMLQVGGKGEPLGASALGQIVELTWQLRGTAGPRQVANTRVGLAHVVGRGANACVTLLVGN